MTVRTRLIAGCAAAAIAAGLVAAAPAQAAATTTVTAGSTIGRGASWNAGSYRFGLSSTGWVGLWNGGTQVWGAPTQTKSATSLSFQSDGNLVAYSGASAVWNTGTGRHPGPPSRFRLIATSSSTPPPALRCGVRAHTTPGLPG